MEELFGKIKKYEMAQKYLHSISYFEASNQLWLEWLSNKNIFNRFIEKVVNENEEITDGYFVKGDGEAHATIVFNLK